MNPRERILAIAVIGVVILGGLGVMFHQFFLSPYRDRKANLELLQKQGQTKELRIAEIAAQRPQLERYRQLSLPADINVAELEYGRFLNGLLNKADIKDIRVTPRRPDARNTPALANKTPIYTKLLFAVEGRTSLDNLSKLLESFYRTALMHQIKTLSVTRPLTLTQGQRNDELNLQMTVEALVVTGAEKRATLMPQFDRRLAAADITSAVSFSPTGLGLALWAIGPFGPLGPGNLADPARDYSAIAFKNIFFGPPPATVKQTEPETELLRHVTLTSITIDVGRKRREAALYDRFTNRQTRLRVMGGFNQFALLQNNQGATLVQGEVMRIDERSLVFRVGINARDPEEKGPDYYKDHEEIYHLTKNDADGLAREGAIRSDDADRVFWVDKGRWDSLIAEKMVSVHGRAFTFRWDLVRGTIIRDDGKALILRMDDKYCSYRYEGSGRPPRPHEGYCTLHVGQSLAEALLQPMKDGEFKTLAAQ
jgi:hypothetical protein